MAQIFLSLDDINQLIKHFAYHIQICIEGFNPSRQYSPISLESKQIIQQHDMMNKILGKYNQYRTSHPLEIKIIKKFIERIKQIFQFFRLRYKPISKNYIDLIQTRVKEKLDDFLGKQIIEVYDLIVYVVSLTKKQTFSTIIKSNTTKKFNLSKRNYLRACSTSIKISSYSNIDNQDEINKTQIKRLNDRQNHTTLQKKSISKSISTFQAIQSGQKENNHRVRPSSTKNRIRPTSTKILRHQKSQNIQQKHQTNQNKCLNRWQKMRKNASQNKKFEPYLKIYYKDQNQKIFRPLQLQKLYIEMNIDSRFLQKLIKKQDLLLRDMLKRNEKIISSSKKQQKRLINRSQMFNQVENLENTGTSQYQNGQTMLSLENFKGLKISNRLNISKEFKNIQNSKSSINRSDVYLKDQEQVLMQVNNFNKRKCLRNLGYQSYLQKKKKTINKLDGVQNKDQIRGMRIQDKQNYQNAP